MLSGKMRRASGSCCQRQTSLQLPQHNQQPQNSRRSVASSCAREISKRGCTAVCNVAAARGLAGRTSHTATTAGLAMPLPVLGQGDSTALHLVGIGQAMVDLAVKVDDASLATILQQCSSQSVPKGSRQVISVEERSRVLANIESHHCPSQLLAGGSLANTLLAIARLAAASNRNLKVALAAIGDDDPLGAYFSAQLSGAGVQVVPGSTQRGSTGTAFVFTTPDAARTFLSFFDSPKLELPSALVQQLSRAQLVAIEGYLWELPCAAQYINAVVAVAKEHGALIALSMGDAGVVRRHQAQINALLDSGNIDVLFSNAEEAAQLLQPIATHGMTPTQTTTTPSSNSSATAAPSAASSASATALATVALLDAADSATALARRCGLAVVTDGARGSLIATSQGTVNVPPFWTTAKPVDTCGAGDGYAAGLIFMLLLGAGAHDAGVFASKVASRVIAKHGAHLQLEDAHELAQDEQLLGLWARGQEWGALEEQLAQLAQQPSATSLL